MDDEPIARQVLREELEQLDAVTVIGEAEDGERALAAVQTLSPQLIALDHEMPCGWEASTAKIRRLQPDGVIPLIVIVTAWISTDLSPFRSRCNRLPF